MIRSRPIAVLAALIAASAPWCSAAELDLYGTFHAMGVIVTLSAGDDPDLNAVAHLESRQQGDVSFHDGFPLTRVADDRFVGSLFQLEPGRTYEVRITFDDPGGVLHNTTLADAAATRDEIVLPAPQRELHVAPDGTGDCSADQPCRLADAVSLAQSGDVVILHGGVYYAGEFALAHSGQADAPIVFRSGSGETAILDGADPAAFSWNSLGGGVYRTVLHTPNPHYISADHERLFPYANLADLETLHWDVPGFYTDGNDLYVRLPGDADPDEVDMKISRFNRAFTVTQAHIAFVDLVFRHYGCGVWAKCLYLDGADDVLVRSCTFAYNDLGVGLKRDAHRNVIEDCEFYDTIFAWPWNGVKDAGGLEDGGITFYDPMTGRGTVIRRNIFHDDFDCCNSCPSNTAGLTNETDVYDNLFYRCSDDGLSSDGQASNLRIWNNTFHDILVGISLAPVYTGPVYAVRNLIYRTGVGNSQYSGYPFKFNSGYDRSGVMYLFHNTSDAVLSGNNGFYIKAPGSWDLIMTRNNIWGGTTYALNNYNTEQPVTMDYDNLWNDGAGDLVRWDSNNYATLAAFQDAVGQEIYGLSVEPFFTDPVTGDYSLQNCSDLIDAGVRITGFNDDFLGVAPDVGAFETNSDTGTGEAPPLRKILEMGCRPNPFTSGTTVHFKLVDPLTISLSVFDVKGRKIAVLHRGEIAAGEASYDWDGSDGHGRAVANGVYFIRLNAGGESRTQRVAFCR